MSRQWQLVSPKLGGRWGLTWKGRAKLIMGASALHQLFLTGMNQAEYSSMLMTHRLV
jgi:hypothetical protein